jgi:DNA-damage-inducible protein J
MAKTAMVRARIEPELKEQVEAVLSQVGLTASQAITLFYKRVADEQGIPFELRVPNARTKNAIEDARNGIGLKRYSTSQDLLDDIQ